jgi:hypothetical protein
MRPRRSAIALTLVFGAAALVSTAGTGAVAPAVMTVYPIAQPRGLMVTSGGWAYCQQVRRLARRTKYTLLCGRYWKDGYVGRDLRSRRQLDWGNPRYLDSLATKARTLHARVRGELLLLGVSYSGFGVATLATHHPDLRPDRLIVVDSYFDLVARREHARTASSTALEIDRETGGSTDALRRRSARIGDLARLVRRGTRLTVIWTISDYEKRLFNGATCDETASAGTLARLADVLKRPVPGWVTRARHGRNLWNHGVAIVRGRNPGVKVVFRPGERIPTRSVC